jgi:hypothetical protein
MLRKYDLCRTPGEEVLHRFKFAKTVDVPSHTFAVHISTMLKCLLQSSAHTKDMGVSFVDGEMLNIDTGLFASTWRFHNRWLTYDGAHRDVYCEDSAAGNEHSFVCDHVVLQLWDIMIGQLMASGDYPSIAEHEGYLKSMARARLSQMPRAVKCCKTSSAGELRVTWESNDSHMNKDKPVRVTLHSDSCMVERESYVRLQSDETVDREQGTLSMHGIVLTKASSNRNCSCPYQVSTAVSDGITFENLDPASSYSAIVSQDMEGAFIAQRPEPTKPLDEVRDAITRPQLKVNNIHGKNVSFSIVFR